MSTKLPRPFRQTATGGVEIRADGGWTYLFGGIPFLAAGIFLTLIGSQILPVDNAREIPWSAWLIIFLMGLIFIAAGGGLAFVRRWITIEQSDGRIVKQWGLLVPMRKEERSLSDYTALVIRLQPGDSRASAWYPVSLKSSSGKMDLELSSPTDYGKAREQAG